MDHQPEPNREQLAAEIIEQQQTEIEQLRREHTLLRQTCELQSVILNLTARKLKQLIRLERRAAALQRRQAEGRRFWDN